MKREEVMFEVIESKVWNVFRKKKVSFAMIYDIDGNILWHKGRDISGKTLNEAKGFSKTYIKEALINGETLKSGGLIKSVNGDNATNSSCCLFLESLIINQISDDYFLYIDSKISDSFSPPDYEMFQVMGEILGNTIHQGRKEDTEIREIVGTSESIKEIRKNIATCSMELEPLLVTGETGTGKNYVAELIHNYSGRTGKFTIIHTPGIPESLFESEFFGHKKGAFTNAAYDKKGLVEEAAGGTLLIDEITEVSVALQAKLLRFIETGKDIRGMIAGSFRYRKIKAKTDTGEDSQIWKYFKEGKDFWEAVKKPYLSRDLKRSEVKALISRGLVESEGSYKKLLNIFNLEKDDYHRFMRFLHEQDLKPGKSYATA
jgi:hypothetical protein